MVSPVMGSSSDMICNRSAQHGRISNQTQAEWSLIEQQLPCQPLHNSSPTLHAADAPCACSMRSDHTLHEMSSHSPSCMWLPVIKACHSPPHIAPPSVGLPQDPTNQHAMTLGSGRIPSHGTRPASAPASVTCVPRFLARCPYRTTAQRVHAGEVSGVHVVPQRVITWPVSLVAILHAMGQGRNSCDAGCCPI